MRLNNIKRFISIFIFMTLFLLLISCSSNEITSSVNKCENNFKVTFIDVGQGDSALVSCNGHHMLIDSGNDEKAADKVLRVIKDNNVSNLDILVASHMDEDHIGGFPSILMHISRVDLVLSNTNNGSTQAFENFKKELATLGVSITVPILSSVYYLGEAKIEIIDNRCLRKNDSLVLLITYKNTSFLFTGDMEHNQEYQIVSRNGIRNQDNLLIKIAHHGANTGTSKDLIEMIKPSYAVISVGDDNIYGHPHSETLKILKDYKVKTYRTDECGDIVVESNGKKIKIIP